MTHVLNRDHQDPFCLTATGVKTWADFLADVSASAGLGGSHDALCSLVQGRYPFTVSLTAAMLEDVPVLMPPSQAQNAVTAVLDGWNTPGSLAPDWRPNGSGDQVDPISLADAPGQIHVFTSGTTGRPAGHVKTWTSLAGGARLTSDLIEQAGLERGTTVIAGTTPHQHMYGLEAAIFASLAHGWCLYDHSVFYPADLQLLGSRAIQAGLTSIVLVTSPAHLKFLAPAIVDTPMIRCVLSATAPLSTDLAAHVEQNDGPPLFEIFGSTETGSLAWRQTTVSDVWEPMDTFQLVETPRGWSAVAPHLDGTMPLGDLLERVGTGFRLIGRQSDMVQIAGKRQSLAALNVALQSMAGIEDGIVLRQVVDGEDQLAVVVVPHEEDRKKPDHLHRDVRKHMLRHVDPVFVPRRTHFVAALPRNETGKVLAADLGRIADDVFGRTNDEAEPRRGTAL